MTFAEGSVSSFETEQTLRDRFSVPSSLQNIASKVRARTPWHERRSDEIQWIFKADPAVDQRGANLYGVEIDYEGGPINLDWVEGVMKVAEAAITLGSGAPQ
jgi:hypothetical protein